MIADDEYRKIGKAILDECLIRGDERCSSIILRSVQSHGKLYIRIKDVAKPISIWDYDTLLDVNHANIVQQERRVLDKFSQRIKGKMEGRKLPSVVE